MANLAHMTGYVLLKGHLQIHSLQSDLYLYFYRKKSSVFVVMKMKIALFILSNSGIMVLAAARAISCFWVTSYLEGDLGAFTAYARIMLNGLIT